MALLLFCSKNITHEEVTKYLEAQGGENVIVLDLKGALDEFRHMVIASGRSLRHIRKMSESIVHAVSSTHMPQLYVLNTYRTVALHFMLPSLYLLPLPFVSTLHFASFVVS